MRKPGLFSVGLGLVMLCCFAASSQVRFDSLYFSGFGSMVGGQIEGGQYKGDQLDHQWQEYFQSQLNAALQVNSRLSIAVGTEITTQYSTLAAQTNGPSYLPGMNIYMNRADMNYKFLEGNFPLTLQAGYFPFKYNPEARNLGEYMFRSGCYPTYIFNFFDFPEARLLGFNVANTLFKENDIISYDQNLLLTSETDIFPYQDFSLSYIGALHIWKNLLTLGGGVCGQRLLSVNQDNTTPHQTSTIAEIKNVRTVTNPITGVPYTTGDTTFFSFAGTKLMARATVDPKAVLPWQGFGKVDMTGFGKEDFKLYGEMAVLGLQNYPVYVDSAHGIGTNPITTPRYDILSERMPFMLGFNWSTHPFLSYGLIPLAAIYFGDQKDYTKNPLALGTAGVLGGVVAGGGMWMLEKFVKENLRLDVLSLEWEYFPNRYYSNAYNEVVGNGVRLPVPYTDAVGNRPAIDTSYAHFVKWSVYARKTVGKNIQIVAQVARDHRHAIINLSDPRYGDYGDNMSGPTDWYYLVKLVYLF